MKLTSLSILLILMLTLTAANCEKSADGCAEEIKKDCMCTMQYKPVCGCNKKTYGNACEAECHGITKYTEGECPK